MRGLSDDGHHLRMSMNVIFIVANNAPAQVGAAFLALRALRTCRNLGNARTFANSRRGGLFMPIFERPARIQICITFTISPALTQPDLL